MEVRETEEPEVLVHLVYLDDGGGGKSTIKVFGGIVVDHQWFSHLETQSALIVHDLLGDDRREQFVEFHASHLYYGEGNFEGIEEAKRHEAFRRLIQIRPMLGIAYVYAAVDTNALNRSLVRSASWIDMAYKMCACAVEEYVRKSHIAAWEQAQKNIQAAQASGGLVVPHLPEALLSLTVIDDTGTQEEKRRIRSTFRSMRQPLARAMQRQDAGGSSFSWSNRLMASVDDVFFGSSAESLGLQVADACNWIMWKHLCGDDTDDIGDLYRDLMAGIVIAAKPEPEWTQYKHLFRVHD